MTEGTDDREPVRALFANLRAALPALEDLLRGQSGHWEYEDPAYRFYHQSFKVYGVQEATCRPLNPWFRQIVAEGTGKRFEPDHNRQWLEETRPMLEAFFHARFFLEMAVRYGKELQAPPNLLPSGWAGLLYLYDLR